MLVNVAWYLEKIKDDPHSNSRYAMFGKPGG